METKAFSYLWFFTNHLLRIETIGPHAVFFQEIKNELLFHSLFIEEFLDIEMPFWFLGDTNEICSHVTHSILIINRHANLTF